MKTVKADPKGVMEGTYFMDGNHAIAEGALAAGCKFFGAYPITPSTEVAERYCERAPYTGGAFVQMEDEIAAIGTLIGAVWAGRKSMTVTSGPGMCLMLENLGLAVMMELPMVIANVQRGGPSTGLPTLVAQQDMMQARWGSHGDYEIIALCPDSPQEAFHLTVTAFNLSETYRCPVIILTDECVGHMHEKVVIPPADEIDVVERKWYEGKKEDYLPYKNDEEDGIPFMVKAGDGYRFHSTGLTHDERGYPQGTIPTQQKQIDQLCGKILNNEEKIVIYEEEEIEGADVIVMSYGITSRVATKATLDARALGLKVGFFRLITVWPFPTKRVAELAKNIKGFVFPEINMGQVVTEAERVVAGKCKVVRVTHCGGAVHNPDDILAAIKEAAK